MTKERKKSPVSLPDDQSVKWHATLKRRWYSQIEILGEFKLFKGNKEVFSAKSLELPWKDNKRRVSCIPTGEYNCKLHTSGDYRNKAFHLSNKGAKEVKGRSAILIHAGNFYLDILGCILLGRHFADVAMLTGNRHIEQDGILDVTYSGETIAELISLTESFALTITGQQPPIERVPLKPLLNERSYKPGEVLEVTASALNFRQTPRGPVKAKLQQGQIIEFLEKKGNWFKVYLTGYVHKDYVK